MRLVFAGTPEFAARALQALLGAGHEVALVLTRPDRPVGRGMKLAASPVKALALRERLAVIQPETLKDGRALDRVAAARPEAIVVAAYGLILPQAVLDVAPHGALNIHASLLPRWRGAAPIQHALLAGDPETGVSIMRMDAGLDTGPVHSRHRLAISPDDDAGSLQDKLAALGASALLGALAELAAGRARFSAQGTEGVTYAPKLGKRQSWLDWSRPAAELERVVRALRPVPGAQASISGHALKIWRSEVTEGDGPPGAVLAAGERGIVVACGVQALALTEVQRAGARRLAAEQFLRGFAIAPGARFELAR